MWDAPRQQAANGSALGDQRLDGFFQHVIELPMSEGRRSCSARNSASQRSAVAIAVVVDVDQLRPLLRARVAHLAGQLDRDQDRVTAGVDLVPQPRRVQDRVDDAGGDVEDRPQIRAAVGPGRPAAGRRPRVIEGAADDGNLLGNDTVRARVVVAPRGLLGWSSLRRSASRAWSLMHLNGGAGACRSLWWARADDPMATSTLRAADQ